MQKSLKSQGKSYNDRWVKKESEQVVKIRIRWANWRRQTTSCPLSWRKVLKANMWSIKGKPHTRKTCSHWVIRARTHTQNNGRKDKSSSSVSSFACVRGARIFFSSFPLSKNDDRQTGALMILHEGRRTNHWFTTCVANVRKLPRTIFAQKSFLSFKSKIKEVAVLPSSNLEQTFYLTYRKSNLNKPLQ